MLWSGEEKATETTRFHLLGCARARMMQDQTHDLQVVVYVALYINKSINKYKYIYNK